jgi:very-short-patch-repair endonuclease
MSSPRLIDQRVPRARRLRRDMTDAERKLWARLRDLPSPASHFRRQATIGPYFVDFACHRSRLVIELDGGQHAQGIQRQRDAERDGFLVQEGYRVLRFWNHNVMQNVDGVLSVISEALAPVETPPTPDPSPPLRGGRGGGGTAGA